MGVVYAADGQFEIVGEVTILVNGEFVPALDFAEECFASWSEYLKERGLE